jgi:hypothetical protein
MRGEPVTGHKLCWKQVRYVYVKAVVIPRPRVAFSLVPAAAALSEKLEFVVRVIL